MSALPGPYPPRLAGRTGPEEFGPGFAGDGGPLRYKYIYCCLLFSEHRVSTSPFYMECLFYANSSQREIGEYGGWEVYSSKKYILQ